MLQPFHLAIPVRDLAEARRAFQKAVEIEEGMCDAWMGLAMVTMQENQGTSGVTDRKTAMTSADAAAYAPRRGATKTACGHSRRARVTGIAERTPNTRAW